MFPFLSDLATYVLELMMAPGPKEWIHIDIFALCVPNLLKTVHVELPNEGGVVIVLEVGGKDFF